MFFMVALHANEKVLEGAGQAGKTEDVLIGLGFEPGKPRSQSLEEGGLEMESNHVTDDSPILSV